MRKIVPISIVLSICLSCQNETPITYTELDGVIHFEHKRIKLSIDEKMRIIPSYFNGEKTQTMVVDQGIANHYLVIQDEKIHDFAFTRKEYSAISNKFGPGQQLKLYGETQNGAPNFRIEKVLTVELYDQFPNAAVTYTTYRNLSGGPLEIDKVVGSSYTMDRKQLDPTKNSYDFSLFQGCGVDWGLDYANINLTPDYAATNFIGITIAHRDPPGGGIPLLDVWSKEMGMAIAHISEKPEFVNLPIQSNADGTVTYAIEEPYSQEYEDIILTSGETFSTIKYAVIVHSLDYFDALRTYAEFLNHQGIKTLKDTPETVPQAYWKTWGYQMDFKVSDIYAKLPEFREFGIEMIVLDDGWFSNYGDWEPSTQKEKFPDGRPSLIKFVEDMHKEGFKVGIWWSPLIAESHTEVAKAHPDWFMQQADGHAYVMEGPDSYFLCPDYAPVLKFWGEQIDKVFITFNMDYVYHDWANLIEVPPCYNPQHNHESPLAPYWNMSKQYRVMYEKAQSIKPGCAIEMCECGRPHDPYKLPFYNITNASDATTKDQVRQKLKVEKALNGSKAYFNPGYILAQPGFGYDPCDIDECVAMGGYFETYYTDLTAERKKEWLKWLTIYQSERIYQGEYLNLYDIAHDVPEFHVTKKGDAVYYFAPGPYTGEIELRGLDSRSYEISDLSTNEVLANVQGSTARLMIDRSTDVYLKATPVD